MIRLRAVVVLIALLPGLLLPAADTAAAGSLQGSVPRGWRRVTWEGVIISYDPKRYVFSTAQPQGQARAAATLLESPDPCPPQGVDCFAEDARLQVYPSGGLDVRSWVARTYPHLADGFTDTIISDRQAIEYLEEAGVFGLLSVYMVLVGADILVIEGSLSDDLAARLQFVRPAPAQLVVGQVAMTKPSRTWDLWSQATGGTRVYERPKLYGGTLLAILAIRPGAVWVRTSDGVIGWIRAPAAIALTPTAEVAGEPARFAGERFVQVVNRTGVALRRSPHSTAPKLLSRLDRGRIIELLGVRGDWVRVVFDDGRIRTIGWARWHYNGVRFIDVVSQ